MSSQQLVDFVQEQLKTVRFSNISCHFIISPLPISLYCNYRYLSLAMMHTSPFSCRKVNFQRFVNECSIGVWHHPLGVRDATTWLWSWFSLKILQVLVLLMRSHILLEQGKVLKKLTTAQAKVVALHSVKLALSLIMGGAITSLWMNTFFSRTGGCWMLVTWL